ncbi:multidrug ABC transporter ATP-binding protein [Clostridium perfringens]|uniref:ATP-binding cassette domain-containing protein n=1 Tax=Clostridium perfringens TaxID=1502 RepID=UPI000D7098C6|nr:ATP-binding cassette domain-containing protein [Clostridium perfringens]PWX52753.1 multidrug ABC transporter ATP-binding protein [Clostridium perfringens]
MLVVNNVSKKYDGVYALLAPNGAGKTTLIKLLTTLIFPTSGEILYKGTDIVSLDGEYRDIIGYLPQDFGYYRNYTPRKFLLYLAALKGIKKEDAVEKVKEVLKVVSLENVENKKMKGFSGGMIQRVGIAQALLNDPKILILDEPTAGLDPKERVRFRNLLSDLSRDRIVIISTHIVSDIEFISNEVIMIKDHKILYKDSIENICSTLEGMVYETSMTFEESKEFRKKYILLSEKQDGGIMKARFISMGNNDEKWIKVNPNIEDVFLYQYRDEELEG